MRGKAIPTDLQNRRWSLSGLGGLALLLSALAVVSAGAQSPAGLPDEAEPYWNDGLEGFRQGDWGRAIRNLVEVQKMAPATPAVLYNLALSYDFSAFRELSAIGWLSTYIAAAPDARNVEQTRVRLADLDEAAMSRLVGLFESAKQAAEPLRTGSDPADLLAAYARIAEGQARSQLLGSDALATADAILEICRGCGRGRAAEERMATLERVLDAQLRAGSLDDAFETAGAMGTDASTRDGAFRDLALAYVARGQSERAQAAIRAIADSGRRDAAGSAVEAAAPSGAGNVDPEPELETWLGFMRDRAPSLESVVDIFTRDVSEEEPVALVEILVEAGVAYGQELAMLRQMQGLR